MADTKPSQPLEALFRSMPKKYWILSCATAVMVGAAIIGFAYWRSSGDYRPIYTHLAPEDAGSIVQKLKEKNVPYQLGTDGSSVLVPKDKVAETRLEMASQGLPKSGRLGFELFDQTKFGATDFMEHVNYRRALEGELERSMIAIAEVEAARIHLTFAKESVFSENRLPAKASVMVKLRTPMSEQNVAAVRFLVASAVEGLAPEAVSVVDSKGNVLGRPKDRTAGDGSASAEAAVDFRRNVEKDLLSKVNTTLEPLLGPDHFRTSVVAECDFSTQEQSEELLDPTRSVITREQESKEMTMAAGASGTPGTASNLPRAVPRPGSNTQVSRDTKDISYQTARTITHTRTPQGRLKRLSVSVLVDNVSRWEGQGSNLKRVSTPPSPEVLDRITEVVSAAAGIVPGRGDTLVVQTLPFQMTQEEPPVGALPEQAPKSPWDTKILSLVGVFLALAAVAWWMMRSQKRIPAPAEVVAKPAALAAPTEAAPEPLQVSAQAVAQQLAKKLEQQRAGLTDSRQRELEAAGSALQRMVGEAIELTKSDSELCAGVLRGWLMEQPREKVREANV